MERGRFWRDEGVGVFRKSIPLIWDFWEIRI
jgi:hypothetical protein